MQPSFATAAIRAGRAGCSAVLAALLLAGTPALAADAGSEAALAAARARWQGAGLTAYEYGYHRICECNKDAPPEIFVTVRDGRVTAVRYRPPGADAEVHAEGRDLEVYWTVEALFDLVAGALKREQTVRVTYHDTAGYPTKLFVDRNLEFIGDELELELTRVSALR